MTAPEDRSEVAGTGYRQPEGASDAPVVAEGEPDARPFPWRDEQGTCFGCGPRNPRGLGLDFVVVGDSVMSSFVPHEDLQGAEGIVHGGMQATIIDEAMGHACYVDELPAPASPDAPDSLSRPPDLNIVTVELTVRYRRPMRVGEPAVVRARMVERRGRHRRVDASIEATDGTVLTTGRGQFLQL